MTVPLSARGYESLYGSWRRMHERCSNPRAHNYARYGGRGIRVCEAWLAWREFKTWALAHGYAPGLTLDRRNNDQGYTPENCRWATPLEQTLNRRTVAKSDDGTPFCEIAKANGINLRTYQDRVARGWSHACAATVRPKRALGRYAEKRS